MWPDLPQLRHIPSFGQLLAMWPGSLQFQQIPLEEHSAAMCLQEFFLKKLQLVCGHSGHVWLKLQSHHN
jgi:hypothetical protein